MRQAANHAHRNAVDCTGGAPSAPERGAMARIDPKALQQADRQWDLSSPSHQSLAHHRGP